MVGGEKLVKAGFLEVVKEGQELSWGRREGTAYLKWVRLGESRDGNQQMPPFCAGNQL